MSLKGLKGQRHLINPVVHDSIPGLVMSGSDSLQTSVRSGKYVFRKIVIFAVRKWSRSLTE